MASCSKIRYPNPAAAVLALRAIQRARAGERGIHPCPTCRGFHLTSDRKSATNKWTRLGLAQVKGAQPRAPMHANLRD